MLAEVDGALIIGLLILLSLIVWVLGWLYAIVRGTAETVRHETTKKPEAKRRID